MTEKSENATEDRRSAVGSEHAQRMLDTVLEHPPRRRQFKQTMIFDIILGFGLLLAVAGFTTGLMKVYLTHMAKQSINQHDYKAAIHILNRSPIPQFLSGSGEENNPDELLNQALYLDAVEKLEADHDDQAALSQLTRIPAGSRYFNLAQQFLNENTKPSPMTLEGTTIHLENSLKEEGVVEEKESKNPLFAEETDNPAATKESEAAPASAPEEKPAEAPVENPAE